MKKRKHILIISGRDTSVEKLEGLPIKITLFQTPDRLTMLQTSMADRVVISNLENHEEIKKIAKAIHEIDPFDAAVSFIEDYLMCTAEIVNDLGINGNCVEAVKYTRNKLEMRKLLNKLDISTVNYSECRNQQDIEDFFKQVGQPIIIKPYDGAGSKKVSIIEKLEDVTSALRWTSGAKSLIAEEYIEGDEYSVEAISYNGQHKILAITAKETTGRPNFIETGHQMPADLDLNIREKIQDVTLGLLKAIGHKEGPTHTEIKIRENTPYIIESHTRYGGDRIWELLYLTTGLHIQQTTICNLLGIQPPSNKKKFNAAAVKFMVASPKVCTGIKGINEAEKVDGIYKIDLSIKPGEEIKPLKSSMERIGYVIGGGNTIEEAWNVACLATESIQIL